MKGHSDTMQYFENIQCLLWKHSYVQINVSVSLFFTFLSTNTPLKQEISKITIKWSAYLVVIFVANPTHAGLLVAYKQQSIRELTGYNYHLWTAPLKQILNVRYIQHTYTTSQSQLFHCVFRSVLWSPLRILN